MTLTMMLALESQQLVLLLAKAILLISPSGFLPSICKQKLVNRSDLLSATAEDGAVIIDLTTLYHIEYQDFSVAAPFSISDVVGSEDYGILKFTGDHLADTDSYQVKVLAKAVVTSAIDFLTIDVKVDGGDAVYTIGSSGADIRNPHVGDV